MTQFYPKKTIIYNEGSNLHGIFIIRKGKVKVYIINNEGAEQIIYFLGKNEFFGHRSVLSDHPSPVFIETIDDCTIGLIPRYNIKILLSNSIELNSVFLYYLGIEFSVFVNKLSLFAQKPVSERVAISLLVLNEKFNRDPQQVKVLNFSREDLASYIGTATESLIRHLKLLKEKNIITTRGRKIIIEDVEALFERANM